VATHDPRQKPDKCTVHCTVRLQAKSIAANLIACEHNIQTHWHAWYWGALEIHAVQLFPSSRWLTVQYNITEGPKLRVRHRRLSLWAHWIVDRAPGHRYTSAPVQAAARSSEPGFLVPQAAENLASL